MARAPDSKSGGCGFESRRTYPTHMEKIKKFVDESISELRKVNFPNAEATRITTIAVISMTFITAGILGIIDFVFSRIFKLIF